MNLDVGSWRWATRVINEPARVKSVESKGDAAGAVTRFEAAAKLTPPGPGAPDVGEARSPIAKGYCP